MKLSLDQNLSHRLLKRLEDLYPDSQHIRLVGLDKADDTLIWEYAKERGFCIVTQDEDYSVLSQLRGVPPKVVWLRCGNTSTDEVERILRQNFNAITELFNSLNLHIAELYF